MIKMKKAVLFEYLCPQARFINLIPISSILTTSTFSTLEKFDDDEESLW